MSRLVAIEASQHRGIKGWLCGCMDTWCSNEHHIPRRIEAIKAVKAVECFERETEKAEEEQRWRQGLVFIFISIRPFVCSSVHSVVVYLSGWLVICVFVCLFVCWVVGLLNGRQTRRTGLKVGIN